VIKDDYSYNEVLHFWTFQDEYGWPTPLRTRFRHVLGLGSDLYAYTSHIYNRGGVIVGYLGTDTKMTNQDDKKGIVQGFRDLLIQREKGRPHELPMAALDSGWKFNRLDLTPQEAQLLDTKKDLQRDFAQIVGVPRWKLGDIEDYHYSTAEVAQREYLASCLNPLLNQIENECNNKLLQPFERDYLYFEFDRDALIALDAKTMAEVDDLAIKNGSMSTDEFRERRNLPHAGYSIRQIPVNMTSDDFVHQAEALKIEGLKLDNALKAAQLAAATKPLPPVTMQVAVEPPPVEDEDDDDGDEEVEDEVEETEQGTETPVSQELPAGAVGDPDDAEGQASLAAASNATSGAVAGPSTSTPSATHTASIATDNSQVDYASKLAAIQKKYLPDFEKLKPKDATGMMKLCEAVFNDIAALYSLDSDYLADFADKYATTTLIRIIDGFDAAYEANRCVNAGNYQAMIAVYGVKVKVKWVGGELDGTTKTIGDVFAGTNLKHPPIDSSETDCFLVPA